MLPTALVNTKHGQTISAANYTGCPTCEDYITTNGTAVARDAHWLFESIQVYEQT